MNTGRPSAHANQRGFITITTVLFLVAVGLATALELLGGIAGMSGAEAVRRDALRARWLADACAEHVRAALQAPPYAGDETLVLSGGSCDVLSVETMATASWQVRTLGRSGDALARVEAEFGAAGASGSPPVIMELSWERVVDF